MSTTEKNNAAVARFRERERMEKAASLERQRQMEELRKENDRKRREIEATKLQIRNTQTLFTTMAQHNPGFGQHPSAKKYS